MLRRNLVNKVVTVHQSRESEPHPFHYVQLIVQNTNHLPIFSLPSLTFHDNEQQQRISQKYERADENDTKNYIITKSLLHQNNTKMSHLPGQQRSGNRTYNQLKMTIDT